MNDLILIKEAAAILEVDPRTVRYWIQDGLFPCIRLSSKTIRVSRYHARFLRWKHESQKNYYGPLGSFIKTVKFPPFDLVAPFSRD